MRVKACCCLAGLVTLAFFRPCSASLVNRFGVAKIGIDTNSQVSARASFSEDYISVFPELRFSFLKRASLCLRGGVVREKYGDEDETGAGAGGDLTIFIFNRPREYFPMRLAVNVGMDYAHTSHVRGYAYEAGVLINRTFSFSSLASLTPYAGAGITIDRTIVDLDDEKATDTDTSGYMLFGTLFRVHGPFYLDVEVKFEDQPIVGVGTGFRFRI